MFFSAENLAKPVQPVSSVLLATMVLVVVATCLLGVGCLVTSVWQATGQWPVSAPAVGASGELLGAALASLMGLLAPMALGCLVLLQDQQLRVERQRFAHAQYEFAIETVFRQRSRPAPPLLAPDQTTCPATSARNANSAALNPLTDPTPNASTLASGVEVTLQQTHLSTLATIRAISAAIAVCELRLTHGVSQAESLELQQLVARLHRRLQRLERDAASDLQECDHE